MRASIRARSLLAVATLALGVALPSALVASSATASTAKRNTGTTVSANSPGQVGVVSYNLYHSNTKAATEVQSITGRPDVDVVGWQEGRNYRTILADVAGWETYQPTSNAAADDPISWRSDRFSLVNANHVMAHTRGTTQMKEKHVVYVTLRHTASGQVFTFLNNHLNARIEAHNLGMPGHPNWKQKVRVEASRNHIRLIRNYMQTMPGIVVATGDFNVAWKADKQVKSDELAFKSLNPVAISNWQWFGAANYLITHPSTKRNIDHIYVERAAVAAGIVRPGAHGVWSGFSSDHRPVWLRLNISGVSQ